MNGNAREVASVNAQTGTSTDLRWSVSATASCLHAAEALALGQLVVDTRMAQAVAEPAQELRRAIVAAGLPRSQFWRTLVGLSAVVDGSRTLAERAVTKTEGAARAQALANELAPLIACLEAAARRAFPELQTDLAPQARRLREQWEDRAPALLRHIAAWSDSRLIPAQAEVVLVHPSLGGGGSAHLPWNNVLLEAVVTDPVPSLPEWLRLGWLLAQLNLDLPVFCDNIHGQRLPHVAELAMLPVTLQAAEELGWLTLDAQSVDLALNSWHVSTPADVDPVDILMRWWGTYLETRPRWDVAFTALDRMFG